LDTSVLVEALQVAALGMSLVFLALTVLLGAILLLGRLFPGLPEPAAIETDSQPSATIGTTLSRAAAIGLALQLSQRAQPIPPPKAAGQTAGAPPSHLWTEHGRRDQMSRRQLP
jgi:Na+-transporting methylmalonyl-CoA/oxaloacetate decarboxylase gamma subunit